MKPTHNPRTPAQAARSARMDRKRAAKFDDDRARDHQDRSNPMTKHLLDEAATLEQRAAELRRQAKLEKEQAAKASRLEVRIRRAVTLPRRDNGMHPAAYDDTRMSTEDLDAADRARPPSITLCQADALKLASVAECLRHLPTSIHNALCAINPAFASASQVERGASYQDIADLAVEKLDSIWK